MKTHAGIEAWWAIVEDALAPLSAGDDERPLADCLTALAEAGQKLAGDAIWAKEDGRALSRCFEDLILHARDAGTVVQTRQFAGILKGVLDGIAVRPPWGGHSRVAIYGLLESRMSRADLVICAGLNEGVWPARGVADALLAPPVLRALGVPGADFRIGLSAHDLAGVMGAPEVVLSRSARDESGPAIPSRFLLRVQALLGDLAETHRETRAIDLARSLTTAEPSPPYPRPALKPSAKQRDVDISATALDRLLGDPYQFYAQKIMQLGDLDALDAEPGPAWQGTTAHLILERWHKLRQTRPSVPIAEVMDRVLDETNAHPLLRALWEPRLLAALEWIVAEVARSQREVLGVECWGEMRFEGVRLHGKADRIDRSADGSLTIIDYKTGKPPSPSAVNQGFALQLGVLGLIANSGGFNGLTGEAEGYEYWSLGRDEKSETGFGYSETPIGRRNGPTEEDFLPDTRRFIAKAVGEYIKGDAPFRARENPDYPAYDTYDQLMRLAEWLPHLDDSEDAT